MRFTSLARSPCIWVLYIADRRFILFIDMVIIVQRVVNVIASDTWLK